MAAYYKVEVTLNSQAVQVGLPSPQSVRVTLPLRGPQGLQGVQGEVGPVGPVGQTGSPGADGREVELQTTETHVQWRYEGESEWTDLVALSAITGPQGIQGETGLTGSAGADGREVELRKTETHVQWRYEDEAEWRDLVALSEITGPQGQTGNQGPAGPANTLAIGTVTTGAAGSSADATLTGDSPAQTLNLVIPRGDKGDQGDQGPPGTATTDAADLTTGTLADARLSSNVPRLDASNTFTQNQTLDGTNNVAPNQTAASGSSLITRDLGDARYFLNDAILHDFYDIPLNNSSGGASGLNAFGIAANGGLTSTFTGGAAPAANSYAVWSNNYSGPTQSNGAIAPRAGFGLHAVIQSPGRDDCYTRLLVGGVLAITDLTLGDLNSKGFGLEIDRSLAGTGNAAWRLRVIYNDGTTTHLGAWSANTTNGRLKVWLINTGTHIEAYTADFVNNDLPSKVWTALPSVATTSGDNFLPASSLHQTFQVVTAGGTAQSIFASIQRVKQTYNFFP
jgi:hypothetical protein